MPQSFSSYSLVSDFWDPIKPALISTQNPFISQKKHERFRIKGFHLFCKGELKHFAIHFTSMLIYFTIGIFTHFKILYYRQTQTIYYVTNSNLKLLDFLSCCESQMPCSPSMTWSQNKHRLFCSIIKFTVHPFLYRCLWLHSSLRKQDSRSSGGNTVEVKCEL